MEMTGFNFELGRFNDDKEDAFQAGYDAAYEGCTHEDNPYEFDPLNAEWERGFDAAFEHMSEEVYDDIVAQQELEDFEGMEIEDFCGGYENF